MESRSMDTVLQNNFNKMIEGDKKLFRVNIPGETLVEKYLGSFKVYTIFKNSSEHDCNACKSFIKKYGNVVSIDSNLNMRSIFDIEEEHEYKHAFDIMKNEVYKASIENIFVETKLNLQKMGYKSSGETSTLGLASNKRVYTDQEIKEFNLEQKEYVFRHLSVSIPSNRIDKSGSSRETLMSDARSGQEVFHRVMESMSLETLTIVRDLIIQGSLLNGNSHEGSINKIMGLKEEYTKIPNDKKSVWCWYKSLFLPNNIIRFRNTLIGVLCCDIDEGKGLTESCLLWNKRVDPVNYKKAKTPITPKQKNDAKKFIEENGYLESFDRIHATYEDLDQISKIYHDRKANADFKKEMAMKKELENSSSEQSPEDDLFSKIQTQTKSATKKGVSVKKELDSVEKVGIDKFVSKILPTCKKIEVFVDSSKTQNFVNITKSRDPNAKGIFKWGNNFAWTYTGNIEGKSEIRNTVAERGGNVNGVLNFRIAWNTTEKPDRSDLDAWACEPNGTRIGYSQGFRKDSGNKYTTMSGQLDVDNMNPGDKLGVENITWYDKSKMQNGTYKLWIHNYSDRGNQGFRAEIEIEGYTYEYEYHDEIRHKGSVNVADVTLSNGKFTVVHHLPVTYTDMYGIRCGDYHKVNMICFSPNHWGENHYGNKHYFFTIENCKTENTLKSFHTSQLNQELTKHKKTMDVIGDIKQIEPSENQLAGLGFNSTANETVKLRVTSSFTRTIEVEF